MPTKLRPCKKSVEKVHQIPQGLRSTSSMEQSRRHHRRIANLLLEKIEHTLMELGLELLETLRRKLAHSLLYAMPQLASSVHSDLVVVNSQLLEGHLPLRPLIITNFAEKIVHPLRRWHTHAARRCCVQQAATIADVGLLVRCFRGGGSCANKEKRGCRCGTPINTIPRYNLESFRRLFIGYVRMILVSIRGSKIFKR